MGWKIGQMIEKTGLTARALHFYEQKGLIGPVFRNASGHRVYSQADLLRLQHIKTLRQLGVPLADMPKSLNEPAQLIPQLKQQLDQLRQQRDAIEMMELKLSQLVNRLASTSPPNDELDDILFQALESMTMYENYFKQSEVEAMHNREHAADTGETIETAWENWVSQMQSQLASGADPKSDAVQTLMAHWHEMVVQLTDKDEDKLHAFNELFHNEPQARKDHGISDELFEFMAQASPNH